MVVFDGDVTNAAGLTARDIVLEVAIIKSLMLAVIDLQVSKVTSTVLSS